MAEQEKPTRVSIVDADLSIGQLLPIINRILIATLIAGAGIAFIIGAVCLMVTMAYSLIRGH